MSGANGDASGALCGGGRGGVGGGFRAAFVLFLCAHARRCFALLPP